MTNPRDPEGLMPDADVTGGPAGETDVGGNIPADSRPASSVDRPQDQATGEDRDDRDPTAERAGRTDADQVGSDPAVRYPDDAEDPSLMAGDASAEIRRRAPDEEG